MLLLSSFFTLILETSFPKDMVLLTFKVGLPTSINLIKKKKSQSLGVVSQALGVEMRAHL